MNNQELINEAIKELQQDSEHEAKNKIKEIIRGIISNQNAIASATASIANYQEQLKLVSVKPINIR